MRGFDIVKAKEALLSMLKWRKEFGVDAIAKVISLPISCLFITNNATE